MLVGCGSLPKLTTLAIIDGDNGDEGVASLLDGLRRGRLPSLLFLALGDTQIGPQGATALASALTKRALPSLAALRLDHDPLGDAGLAALLPALRRLPKLILLGLCGINIGDEGVASLVAQPTAGALKYLDLQSNQITDAGCATLVTALRDWVVPALRRRRARRISLNGNPAMSQQAKAEVWAALDAHL